VEVTGREEPSVRTGDPQADEVLGRRNPQFEVDADDPRVARALEMDARTPSDAERPADPITMPNQTPMNMPAALPGEGKGRSALTIPDDRAVSEPIVVANNLWTAADPAAYNGGLPPSVTHLRAMEQEDKTDNGRWSGALTLIPTKADYVLDLIRLNSLWPLLSGLACCAIEMMSAATSRNDMDRFGMFPFRASPRQADVLIAAGTLTTKMAGPFLRLWEQMPEPKWSVAMGDCTVSGGRYKRSYSTVQGIDRIMPVDVYVPGCPPRPEGLIYGMLKLQQLIKERRGHWAERQVGPSVPTGV
jgi:NADH-quinone oxidoreductase subunit B